MIATDTLITYLLILLGFVFIPGPAVLLTLARSAGSGTRAGLATAAGIAVGDVAHTAMAAFGLSAILLASGLAFALVKYAGAAYLFYLGVRMLLEARGNDGVPSVPRLSAGRAFRQAILAEMLNPKSALFFLAFLPQFVDPARGQVVGQLAVLGVLFVLMGLLSTVVVALAAGRLGATLRRHPALMRWQARAAGGIYCALGLRMALQER